ncbi:MAG TPA: Re/Si-specific NAD(P)(+) transhydrogenase subunit alpha [Gemmatimonadales bacterium]|nr:Re/Si-specific NAD(P)(+) transhydrogenase subunit alpha [Gemmatimonadales bacterium]
MRIGVPKEIAANERRVALTPDVAGRLTKGGFEVVIERGAGTAAFFPDEAYSGASVQVTDRASVLSQSDIVVQVQAPSAAELAQYREGAALVAFFQPAAEFVRQLAQRRLTAFSLVLLPRITRAQPMDVLSSQATVAGYKAVLLAASATGRLLPMLVTAAGTLPAARVLVLGAGVAGLQAIATARRLGAIVSAFDVRPAVKEQVQSLGAAFLEMAIEEHAETAGGYAKELSEETHRKELAFLAAAVKDADIVIATAAIPGKKAPILITAAAVQGMKPGSVIVDLAAETGGNCELTQPGSEIVRNGVSILGPLNLASTVPLHASQMYAKNVAAFLGHIVQDGKLRLDFEDQITRDTCVTHAGEVRKS